MLLCSHVIAFLCYRVCWLVVLFLCCYGVVLMYCGVVVALLPCEFVDMSACARVLLLFRLCIVFLLCC